MKRSSSGEPERVSAFGAAFRPLDGLAHRDGFGGHAVKRVKSSSSSDGAPEGFNLVERISDPHKLASRRKQIDFGKNTLSYERYSREVPRSARKETDPKTPDITNPMSKRRFDGMIKAWRRGLHEWEQNNPLPGASGGSEEHQAGHDAPARAGLSGCADNFDDYLDGVLNGESDGDAGALGAPTGPGPEPPAAAQAGAAASHEGDGGIEDVGARRKRAPPASFLPDYEESITPVGEPPDGQGSSSERDAAREQRRRLDAFKTAHTTPQTEVQAPAPTAGIFSAFDDGLG